jgi:hypothetical protein
MCRSYQASGAGREFDCGAAAEFGTGVGEPDGNSVDNRLAGAMRNRRRSRVAREPIDR